MCPESPSDQSATLSHLNVRREERGGWFFVSLGIHVAALLLLAYLTPVRELVKPVFEPKPKEPQMSGAALRELAENLQFSAAERIRTNVRELDRVLDEMSNIQETMAEDFSTFEQQRARQAAEDAAEQMEAALEHMEKATEAMENDATVKEVDQHQALAERAQERAMNKLDLSPLDVSETKTTHKKAQEVHQESKAAHDEDAELRVDVQAVERSIEQVEGEKKSLEERFEAMNAEEREGGRGKRLKDDIQKRKERIAEREEQAAEVRKQQEKALKKAIEMQEEAATAQQEALDTLQTAIEKHKAMMASQTGGAETGEASGGPQIPAIHTGTEEGAEETADLGELYTGARQMEDNIAETLKEVRAMDLAVVRDIKLEQAREDIDLVRPVRPDLNTELLREEVKTGKRFEEHNEEVEKALRETTSMVDLAYRMLEMANQSVEDMKFGTPAGHAEIEPSATELELIIRELAMEDVTGRFSDMAAMMEAMAEQQQAEGEEEGEEGAQMGRMALQDIEDLTQEQTRQGTQFQISEEGENAGDMPYLSPETPKLGARKITSDGIPSRWLYIDSWYTIGPFPNPNRVNIDREFPPDSLVDLDATYRGKGGRTIRWQFVQSHMPEVVPPNREEYGIWYAYTELYCEEAMDAWIALGTDDRGVLKINGVPVWISSKRLKGWDVDEVWRRVHLRKGVNRLLYRVENGWYHIGFSMVMRLDEPE